MEIFLLGMCKIRFRKRTKAQPKEEVYKKEVRNSYD